MARGGSRNGAQGSSYTNRTDLNVKPIRTGPVIPTPQGPSAPTAPSQVQTGPIGSPQQIPQVQFSPHPNPPGSSGAFNRPTERESEPLTHGMAFGPGGGPEVMPVPSPAQGNISGLLGILAQQTGNNELSVLAAKARAANQ